MKVYLLHKCFKFTKNPAKKQTSLNYHIIYRTIMKILHHLLLASFIIFTTHSNAENELSSEDPDQGKVSATLFTEFNTTLNNDNYKSAFEVNRAYLGYSKALNQGFSAEIKLDIGAPNDASGELHRRFAYVKTAALYYNYKKVRLEFGMINTTQFIGAEGFWDKRYISKIFMDAYSFGSTADLGLKAIYSFNNSYAIDFSVLNGEGYQSLQNDDFYKTTIGFTAQPFDGFVGRIYADVEPKTVTQNTFSLFAGQTVHRYHLGVEYSHQFNHRHNENADRYGYSILGKVDITDKINILGRFDYIDSKIGSVKDDFEPFKDGQLLIGGAEYIVSNQVRLSLNYRQWTPSIEGAKNVSSLHASLEIKF